MVVVVGAVGAFGAFHQNRYVRNWKRREKGRIQARRRIYRGNTHNTLYPAIEVLTEFHIEAGSRIVGVPSIGANN